MSMASTAVAATLQDELQATETLIALMQQEQQQLIDAQVDALPALTERKSVLLAQLSTLTRRRHAALAAAGVRADESGMRDWLAAQDVSSAAVAQSWQLLRSHCDTAREQNRINGMLISRHLVRGQTELNILQGQPQHSTLYGRNGQTATAAAGRGRAIG